MGERSPTMDLLNEFLNQEEPDEISRYETARLDMRARAAKHGRPDDPPDPFLGAVVGPCQIEEPLGEGAFGRVYRATHRRLHKEVALKLLTGVSSSKTLRRFEREAKASARLADRNVAKVYQFGYEEGNPFLVQELVRGESLTERIERSGPLPLEQAVWLGAGIAKGLFAIHRAGLLHRDLKPDNVMITSEEVPKIVDFGLVRVVGEDDSLTADGMLVGTPAFLAPEVVQSRQTGEDEQADLYALGCVLYLLLSGKVPHMDADDDQLVAFFARRLAGPPPDIRSLRPEVPDTLARMIGALLEPTPGARPGARQVHGILEVVHLEVSSRSNSRTLSGRFVEIPAVPSTASGSARLKARHGGSSTRLRPVKASRTGKTHKTRRSSSSSRLAAKRKQSTRTQAAKAVKPKRRPSSARTPATKTKPAARGKASTRARAATAARRTARPSGTGTHAVGALPIGIAAVAAALAIGLGMLLLFESPAPKGRKAKKRAAAAATPAAATPARRMPPRSVRLASASKPRQTTAPQAARPAPQAPARPAAKKAATEATDPDYARARQKALERERSGRWFSAIGVYRKFLKDHPESPRAGDARAAMQALSTRLQGQLESDLAKLDKLLRQGRRDKAAEVLLSSVGKYGGPKAEQAMRAKANQKTLEALIQALALLPAKGDRRGWNKINAALEAMTGHTLRDGQTWEAWWKTQQAAATTAATRR